MSINKERLSKQKKKLQDAFLEKKFKERFSTLAQAKEAQAQKDYKTVVKKYFEYINTLATVFKTTTYELRPKHFSDPMLQNEMVVVSQIYYELAKILDQIPQKKSDVQKCLDQFVNFSVNQKYQVLNSERLRKELKVGKFKNKDIFNAALKKIYSGSSKCFIATYALGEQHWATHQLRLFKNNILMRLPWGKPLVGFYYYQSEKIVDFCETTNSPVKQLIIVSGKLLALPLACLVSIFLKIGQPKQ